MIRRFLQRIGQFLSGPSERRQQLLDLRRRDVQPRSRVRIGSYRCGACGTECGSLDRMRQHTLACLLEARRHHADSLRPTAGVTLRVNGTAVRGEAGSEGRAR